MADKPDNKARSQRMFVDGYSKSPELLEYKLLLVFDVLENNDSVSGHNRAIKDIVIMIGEDNLMKLVEEVAQSILNVSKAELLKEKK